MFTGQLISQTWSILNETNWDLEWMIFFVEKWWHIYLLRMVIVFLRVNCSDWWNTWMVWMMKDLWTFHPLKSLVLKIYYTHTHSFSSLHLTPSPIIFFNRDLCWMGFSSFHILLRVDICLHLVHFIHSHDDDLEQKYSSVQSECTCLLFGDAGSIQFLSFIFFYLWSSTLFILKFRWAVFQDSQPYFFSSENQRERSALQDIGCSDWALWVCMDVCSPKRGVFGKYSPLSKKGIWKRRKRWSSKIQHYWHGSQLFSSLKSVSWKQKKKKKGTIIFLFFLFFFFWSDLFILIISVILLVWTAAFPFTPSQETSDILEDNEVMIVCSSEHSQIFLIILFIYKGLLVLFGCFLAFSTRKVASAYNESRQIGTAMYSIFFVGAILVPLIFLLDVKPDIEFSLISVATLWVLTITLGYLFLPKLVIQTEKKKK